MDQHELELFRSRLQNWLAWKPLEPSMHNHEEEELFPDHDGNIPTSHQGYETGLSVNRTGARHQAFDGQTALDHAYDEDPHFHESIRQEVLRSHLKSGQQPFTLIHKVAVGSVLFLAGTLLAVLMLGS